MARVIALSERYDRGRIEVWRRHDGEPWFVTILPDPGEEGYPGHTYSHASDLPNDAGSDPAALLEWARKRLSRREE
jgi:hypothetical protein